MLIGPDLNVIERAQIQYPREFLVPSNLAIRDATSTRPVVYLPEEADYVSAVVPIAGYENIYLYVARPIDPQVVQYLRTTQASVAEFASLEERRLGVQVAFALMYAVIAMILLLSAIWLGINFANRLVAPIRRLITAANLVASGNLFVQVPVRRSEGDLANLGESFNTMTQELRSQHDDIVRARDQIDQRRRFTEAVLAGVGAGVIGLDPEGRITILNRSAGQIVGRGEAELIGVPMVDAMPELAGLVAEALAGSARVQGTAQLVRGGRERTINVRVTTEQSRESEHGYVITLDDITELVVAQRSSAWADIARRIAHEIKNPLTPIQLSAERLRRKYGKVLLEDREVFEQCTDTIIRQVGDIGRMVDEFSSFARTAEAGGRAAGSRGDDPAGRISHARRPTRYRLRRGAADARGAGAIRPPADLAGAHQHREERDRGDRRRAGGGTRRGPHSDSPRARRPRRGDRRDRQRDRASRGRPRAAIRALRHDARERHRPRPCDRGQNSRGARRPRRALRCACGRARRARGLGAVAVCDRGPDDCSPFRRQA